MPYHVLSSRDRQILKDGLARLRTMPPTETWRTQRQIFGGGSGGRAVIIADALEDVSTGLSGSFRRQKGPLGGLTDDDVGMGGGMGGFDSGFDSGFDTTAPPEIDAWNICDAPIWTGARCVLAWCVLPHGSLPKSGWVVVESNSATRIRATTPGGGVTAGNSGTFTGVVPLDGVYDPTTASIYLPTGATALDAGDRVCADWNYLTGRWEAEPDKGGTGSSVTWYTYRFSGSATLDTTDESSTTPIPSTGFGTDTNLSVASDILTVTTGAHYLVICDGKIKNNLFSGGSDQAAQAWLQLYRDQGTGTWTGLAGIEISVDNLKPISTADATHGSTTVVRDFVDGEKLKWLLTTWDDNGVGLSAPCEWSAIFQRIE